MPNLRATVLLKCLFLMSGERSPLSSTKESDPLRFARLLLLFLQTAHLAVFFFFFWMRVVVGLFPDSLQSVCISDFTQGKSSPSAAVNSGDVETAH